jgi:D-alanyl-D-alanine carboxypeptidase
VTFVLRLVFAGSSLLAVAAGARDAGQSGADTAPVDEGRVPTHLAYSTAPRAELSRPPGALHGQCEAVQRDMKADLAALLARARHDPEVGPAIVALSCYRSPRHQANLFGRARRASAPPLQAYQVAPPGYSEHATGLAIDFGDRRRGCNLVACFAATPVGRWLAANAADFGFEMSFPQDNAQGVAFEPWHWRWVGRDGDQSSLRARAIFAAARERFPVARTLAVARVDLADSAPLSARLLAARLLAVSLAETAPAAPTPAQAGK